MPARGRGRRRGPEQEAIVPRAGAGDVVSSNPLGKESWNHASRTMKDSRRLYEGARGGVATAPQRGGTATAGSCTSLLRPHAHEGTDIAAVLDLRDPPFCLEDAMRSKLLLGLLALAACERVRPPVAPPQFDGSASESGSGRIAFVSNRD